MKAELGIRNYELGIAEEEKQACESYEAAMSYDCRICKDENCKFRKGTAGPLSISALLLIVSILAVLFGGLVIDLFMFIYLVIF